MRDRTIRLLAGFCFVAGFLALTREGSAQLLSVDVSNDITWLSGVTAVDDEGARRVILPSTVSSLDLGALPVNADVTAYQMLDDGRRVFALDTFVDFGGGLTAGPEDLIAWNGAAYSLYFDGSVAGIPPGTTIDAIGWQRQLGVVYKLFSFDVPVSLPGPVFADDEDVVAWNGMVWTMFFDGSTNGIPESLDVDGFDRDPVNGNRYLSFDTSGKVSTVDFDDEDVVAFDGMNWSLAFDASANLDPTFAAGDLDAMGVRTVNIFKDGFEIASTIEWSSANP